ncbi:hypothetical protein J8I29_22535 [Labrys sp. LIt4]|uniref:hypothetical protein n=1 Tax=Labrys sp. LIt4 TaxID=2821355 RepID=UPI001ADFFD79|nr:hypothetical protein [Labrys sp. LIt4]MBP0582123.1 hypothetical protein [Labrys sp. LIt4]
MVIPRLFASNHGSTAQIGPHEKLIREVNGKKITFIVEHPNDGFLHACSVDDVLFMLSHIPSADLTWLDTFVFRQSTRKTRIINPAWGRLYYLADLTFIPWRGRWRGPALFLEACKANEVIKWPTSLDREDATELERLRADGHDIERIGRNHIISSKIEAVRSTQLYRTLLHEIGHWVDWLEQVETRDGDFSELVDLYFARPQNERETFAHRYADHWQEILRNKGIIPFDRMG